jgi:hypothetical protein
MISLASSPVATFRSQGFYTGPLGPGGFAWNDPTSWSLLSGTSSTGIPGGGDDVQISLFTNSIGYTVAVTDTENANNLTFTYNGLGVPDPTAQVLALDITGGSLSLAGYVQGTGTAHNQPDGTTQASIDLTGGGSLKVATANPTNDSSLTVSFGDGAGDVLSLGMFNGTAATSQGFLDPIVGLSGTDEVQLTGFSYSALAGYSYGSNSLHLFSSSSGGFVDAADLTISTGNGQLQVVDGPGGFVTIEEAQCFCPGTKLLTPTGEVAVEDVRAGDVVMTLADGALVAAEVVWTGERVIDLGRHPRPEAAHPVRIRAGACGNGLPRRDLLVSPDHALFIEGHLVPAKLLLNGASIVQESGFALVRYHHVELGRHGILLAEGLPAESYLDTGTRGFFARFGEPLVLHPDFAANPDRASGGCAPLALDSATVEPIWRRLADLAAARGHALPAAPATTSDPALCLSVGGRMVAPILARNGRYVFALPVEALGDRLPEAWLVSRSAAPSETRPWLNDGRRLGVSVARIVLGAADMVTEIPVDHPGLAAGWWGVERQASAQWRWTTGRAALPLPAGTDRVEIYIAACVDYRLPGEDRRVA